MQAHYLFHLSCIFTCGYILVSFFAAAPRKKSDSSAVPNIESPPPIGSLPSLHKDVVEHFLGSNPTKDASKLADNCSILLNLDTPAHTVSNGYLSVTLDACGLVFDWKFIDFKSPRVINIAKALSPAMLRVGGIYQNLATFDRKAVPHDHLNEREYDCFPSEFNNFILTPANVLAVLEFAREVGWNVTFGLNPHSHDEKHWNPHKSEELMRYVTENSFQVNWELGSSTDGWYL